MTQNRFDYVPSSVNHARSLFRVNKPFSASYYLGFLYPLGKPWPIIPGDTLSLDLAGEIRSQPLIAPLMDEIHCDIFAFWVPNRIVWEHWKQFLGSADDVMFDSLPTYSIPTVQYGALRDITDASRGPFYWNQMLACHMELQHPGVGASVGANCPVISALPNRGYNFIYNLYFIREQIQSRILFSKTDNGTTGMNIKTIESTITIAGITGLVPDVDPGTTTSQVNDYGVCLPTDRFNNLYTTCLPTPNLGTYGEFDCLEGLAPVMYNNSMPSGTVSTATFNPVTGDTFSSGLSPVTRTVDIGSDSDTVPIVADMQNVSIVLNKFREGVLLGRMYETLNRAGARYDELLGNLWHVTAPAAVIDIPELVVQKHFSIYRNQVIATAETAGTPIGSQKAYIDTVIRDSLFTKSFTEHGYLHVMVTFRAGVIRHCEGFDPDWFITTREELYFPQFDGMGDVARFKRELYWNFGASRASQNGVVFGYQEFGAEYKSQIGRSVGWTDPSVPNSNNYYTLCDNLAGAPTLNFGYINAGYRDNNNFARCLSIPSPWNAPQFVCDWRFTGKWAREMKVYNIPGVGGVL